MPKLWFDSPCLKGLTETGQLEQGLAKEMGNLFEGRGPPNKISFSIMVSPERISFLEQLIQANLYF